MEIHVGRKFWIVVTAVIACFTAVIVGRNLLHLLRVTRQINELNRAKAEYEARIAADSTLLEQLRYDDYLEEYAREHYRMERPGDEVFLVK